MTVFPPRFVTGAIALAALLAFAPVHAAGPVHIEASAFTFDTSSEGRADVLLADSNGVATISLLSGIDALRYPEPQSSGYHWYQKLYSGVFALNVRPGYKMTGYSLSGVFFGQRRVGQMPDEPGGPAMAGSAAISAGMAIRTQDPATAPSPYIYLNETGTDAFTLRSGALDHTGALDLYVDGNTAGEAIASEWYNPSEGMHMSSSEAMIELRGPLLLTIYTQAIPEPHSYALTLAGLALIGGVLGRRRRCAGLAGR